MKSQKPRKSHRPMPNIFITLHRHLLLLVLVLVLILLLLRRRRRSLRLESLREPPDIALNRPMIPQELHIRPVDQQLPGSTLLEVFFAAQRGEAPVLADDDLLAAREFVLRAAEGFDGCCAVCGRGGDMLVGGCLQKTWSWESLGKGAWEWGKEVANYWLKWRKRRRRTYCYRESEQRARSGRCSRGPRCRWACPTHRACPSAACRRRHRTTSC